MICSGQEVNAIAMMPVEDERIREKINLFSREYKIPIVTFNSDIEERTGFALSVRMQSCAGKRRQP